MSTPNLTAFRQAAVSALTRGDNGDGEVRAAMARCFPTEVPQCLKRLCEFAARGELAAAADDATAAQASEKRPPDEFLRPGAAGLEYILPEGIEKLAAANGWTAVRYKSRQAGGFDAQTSSLLMVYIPGPEIDRWLNFSLPADAGPAALLPTPQAAVPSAEDYAAETDEASLPRTFTMVSLAKAAGGAKIYFQKFHREALGSAVFTPEENSSVDGCASCHPNGLRAISPLGYHARAGEARLSPDAVEAVRRINAAMLQAAGGRLIDWRGAGGMPFYRPLAQGSAIGPRTPLAGGLTRSEAFLKACAAARPTIEVPDIFGRAVGAANIYRFSGRQTPRWDRVATAMRCATCHDNRTHSALTGNIDQSQIDFKILVDQSMPLGMHDDDTGADELTEDERIALANCLQAEFERERLAVSEWLSQETCP